MSLKDLTEFISRCIETDEVFARNAAGFEEENWNAKRGKLGPEVDVGGAIWSREVPYGVWDCDDFSDEEGCEDMRLTWMDQARHIARWCPEKVLAECAIKRELLRIHTHVSDAWDQRGDAEYDFGCQTCHYDMDCGNVVASGWCETVVALVRSYRGWAGFKEEWL